jgi:hypothetical protein
MECTICLSNISKVTLCSPFACDHTFHGTCISKWNGKCPNCRALRKKKSLLDFKKPTIVPVNTLLGILCVRTCHELFHNQHAFRKSTCIVVKCSDCKSRKVIHYI